MNFKKIESLTWNGCRVIWKIQDQINQILVDEFAHRIAYPRSANFHTSMNSVKNAVKVKAKSYKFKKI